MYPIHVNLHTHTHTHNTTLTHQKNTVRVGGPVYQMAQNPHHMGDEWHGSQDLLTEEGEDDMPDIALGSNTSTSRNYNPNTLKEMVDLFHEGDKVLDGKKKKKDKKITAL